MWPAEFGNPGDGPFEQRGTIEFKRTQVAEKKPVWFVLLKLAGLALMLPIGFLIVMPSIPLPWWQSALLAALVLVAYAVTAHFVRFDPDTDNLGWAGGAFNDPTQHNDNINRWLWRMHCAMGPGRFAAAAVIDALVLVGALPEVTVEDVAEKQAERAAAAQATREAQLLARVEARRASSHHQGAVELSSVKYFGPQPPEEN